MLLAVSEIGLAMFGVRHLGVARVDMTSRAPFRGIVRLCRLDRKAASLAMWWPCKGPED